MQSRFLNGPVPKLLVITGVIAAAGLWIYLTAGIPAPDERNRVTSSNGAISIVAPPGWPTEIAYSPPGQRFRVSIVARPEKSLELNRLTVGMLGKTPDLADLNPLETLKTTFQGQSAYILVRVIKKQYYCRLAFERDGTWYEIELNLKVPIDIEHSVWWNYFNTFRANKVPAPATFSTMPTTMP